MIDTRNWQISLTDPAATAEGIEDIAQCVYVILVTVPGSDPLRPDFGSGIHKTIDRPMSEALPMAVYEAVTAIERWEKRIEVKKCTLSSSGLDGRTIEITAEVVASAAEMNIKVKI